MTHLSLFVAAIAMATGVLTQGSKDTAGGAALQGTWTLVTLNGQPAPEGAPELTLTFSGDTLRACFAAPGAAGRPTDFTVKEGVIVFVGKKAKS